MNTIYYINGVVAANQSDPWEGVPIEPMEGGEAVAVPADVPGHLLGDRQLHPDYHGRQATWRPNWTLLIVEDE